MLNFLLITTPFPTFPQGEGAILSPLGEIRKGVRTNKS
jgi:hypothetical protein